MEPAKGSAAPRTLDGIRAGKYIFRAAYLLVSLLILLIVAAPILGAVTPQVAPQSELGLGVNLQTVQPQLQQIFPSSGGSSVGSGVLTVPAFNKWFLPGSVTLSLSLAINGTTVYQTQKATVDLAPFQTGVVTLNVDVPASTIQQMQGHSIGGGGQLTLDEAGLWSITVSLGQG